VPRGVDDRNPGTSGDGLFVTTLAEPGRYASGSKLGAPVGLAVHAFAIGALALASLSTTATELRPPRNLASPLLRLAPPPPARPAGAPQQDAPVDAVSPAAVTSSFVASERFTAIPEQMLTAGFVPTAEIPNGFADGSASGLDVGLREGVVGGVPGGVVSGVIGGTGTDIPKFPKADTAPKPIRMPRAKYPEEAIRQNITGSVKLLVVVNEQGRVEVLRVTSSIPELDGPAIQIVESSWRFEPAMKNGRPISCVSSVVVRFNLR